MQETSLTEPTELRNQSWDKRRRTIRKCQVVLHWNLSRLSPCDCCLQGHWHFSALRWLHTSGHTLNVHSHLSAKRLADKIGRDKSTFISVCERQPCPAGVARSLVQIPPAWRKESRALPGSDLGGGEQSGSWIPESLRSRLSLRGGASQLRRAQGTFGLPGP